MKFLRSKYCALTVALILSCFGAACLGSSKQDIPKLIRQTQSKVAHDRNTACLALASLGPEAEEAVPVLARLLKDQNSGVRSSAAYALRAIATPDAQKALDRYQK